MHACVNTGITQVAITDVRNPRLSYNFKLSSPDKKEALSAYFTTLKWRGCRWLSSEGEMGNTHMALSCTCLRLDEVGGFFSLYKPYVQSEETH